MGSAGSRPRISSATVFGRVYTTCRSSPSSIASQIYRAMEKIEIIKGQMKDNIAMMLQQTENLEQCAQDAESCTKEAGE